MQKHVFKMTMPEIFTLFFSNTRDEVVDYIDGIVETESQYSYDLAQEVVESLSEAAEPEDYLELISSLIKNGNIGKAIIEKVANSLKGLERIYKGDEDIKLNIFIEDSIKQYDILGDDKVCTFTIETKDLENVMRIGMNAYGEFDWDAHSQGDKNALLKDGYYILREILHYHEACEYKIELSMPDYDDLIEMPSIDEVMEALEKEKQNANPLG